MRTLLLSLLVTCLAASARGQDASITGTLTDAHGEPLGYATVGLPELSLGAVSEADGTFALGGVPVGTHTLHVQLVGYAPLDTALTVDGAALTLALRLEETSALLDEVVVTGTMRPVSRRESPVPVEVYTEAFFLADPTPSVFEGLRQVNGVRPQLNCNVCNTGDIHINGLEGPYTMVTIDGMPIVSGLSTVYGLTGIPRSLIAQTEIVKGPASALYGSEAVGGVINLITVSPEAAPRLSADVMATSWGEVNVDLGARLRVAERVRGLVGVNAFGYGSPRDGNGDGFTDLTLQRRVSVFNKWVVGRPHGRAASLAGRFLAEERWGGQMDWTRADYGGDGVYGEAISTRRWEAFGTVPLGLKGLTAQFSANGHRQRSAYGTTVFDADQYVGFGQVTYVDDLGAGHELLAGATYRYTYYNDNTGATGGPSGGEADAPAVIHLPGAFLQDQWRFAPGHTLLAGLRYDRDSRHGDILTPRLNYKFSTPDYTHTLRLGVGNGYRVANVFTEDHAALTGARRVVFAEALAPERSWNVNANYVYRLELGTRATAGLDASVWYTRFSNRILPDYTTDVNAITYRNLDGFAVSRGTSVNLDYTHASSLALKLGVTLQDVFVDEGAGRREQQLTEAASAVWQATFPLSIGVVALKLDYTGTLYGPMALPLLGPLDSRPAYSPWYSLQNLQLTHTFGSGVEVYGGVKNLLNYLPPANSIARAFDPFDRGVTFGADGQTVATPNNPEALTFDPSYVYAPNQGIRGFVGARWRME